MILRKNRGLWTVYNLSSTLDNIPSTVDILPSTLDKNLHSKSTYFLKLTHQERVMEVQWFLKRAHSRPQSPSFHGHVVLKREALEAAVTRCPTSGHAWAEVTNITAHSHNRFLSLTAPLGTKILLPELSPECGFFGLFWKNRLHSTRIHCQFGVKGTILTKTSWTHR